MNLNAETHFLPPYSLVTASSEATLSGCEEPEAVDFSGGRFSQHLPVGTQEISKISLLLAAREGEPGPAREIPARIFRCDSATDFGSGLNASRPLAETALFWNGADRHWIDWEPGLTPLSGMKVGTYIRIELDLPSGIGWMRHRRYDPVLPGALAEPGQDLRFSHPGFTHCFRVSPEQPCYWAPNVLPEAPNRNRFTGSWKSDPEEGLPQWLEVSWRDPLPLEGLALDFPDSDECPTHYRVHLFFPNEESHEIDVPENSQTHAVHRFEHPVSVERIRIDFLETRGGDAISMNRIRLLVSPTALSGTQQHP